MCVTIIKKNSTVKIRSGSDDVFSIGTSLSSLFLAKYLFLIFFSPLTSYL